MTETSRSGRRVEKMLVVAVALLATAALFTAGCSRSNTSVADDVTGSVGSQAQRAKYPAPPNVATVATVPATRVSANPAGSATCGSTEAASDVTGSISNQAVIRNRSLVRKAGPVGSMVIHVIEPSETLYSIAHSHHTTVGNVARINEINPRSKIRVGYWLIVPHA